MPCPEGQRVERGPQQKRAGNAQAIAGERQDQQRRDHRCQQDMMDDPRREQSRGQRAERRNEQDQKQGEGRAEPFAACRLDPADREVPGDGCSREAGEQGRVDIPAAEPLARTGRGAAIWNPVRLHAFSDHPRNDGTDRHRVGSRGRSGSRRWRPEPESNRRARICSPLRNHSAIGPREVGRHWGRRGRRVKAHFRQTGALAAWPSRPPPIKPDLNRHCIMCI